MQLLIRDIQWDDEGQGDAACGLPDAVIVFGAPEDWLTPQYRSAVLGDVQELGGFLLRDAEITPIVFKPGEPSILPAFRRVLMIPSPVPEPQVFTAGGERRGQATITGTVPLRPWRELVVCTSPLLVATDAVGFEVPASQAVEAWDEYASWKTDALRSEAALLDQSLKEANVRSDDPQLGPLYKMRIVLALREHFETQFGYSDA